RFTVEFPGTPVVQPANPVQTAIGPVNIFSVDLDLPNVGYYAVTFTDYPPNAVGTPDAVLEGAKNGAVSNVHGTLVDEKRITVQGNKGLDLKVVASQHTIFQRLVIAQNRLYQLIVVVSGPRATVPPDVLHFDQSFVITH
ncbi:MAG TPA: hypothetical protein VGH87_28545, partial [Polyangiaceae bacterium]